MATGVVEAYGQRYITSDAPAYRQYVEIFNELPRNEQKNLHTRLRAKLIKGMPVNDALIAALGQWYEPPEPAPAPIKIKIKRKVAAPVAESAAAPPPPPEPEPEPAKKVSKVLLTYKKTYHDNYEDKEVVVKSNKGESFTDFVARVKALYEAADEKAKERQRQLEEQEDKYRDKLDELTQEFDKWAVPMVSTDNLPDDEAEYANEHDVDLDYDDKFRDWIREFQDLLADNEPKYSDMLDAAQDWWDDNQDEIIKENKIRRYALLQNHPDIIQAEKAGLWNWLRKSKIFSDELADPGNLVYKEWMKPRKDDIDAIYPTVKWIWEHIESGAYKVDETEEDTWRDEWETVKELYDLKHNPKPKPKPAAAPPPRAAPEPKYRIPKTQPESFAALGIPMTSTNEDIKKAYRKLVLKHHPDKGGDAELFKVIDGAYKYLKELRGFGRRKRK